MPMRHGEFGGSGAVLEGIFAFALWDSARRRLILMRDRLGIKPLFYAWQDGRLIFGSEIKAVLAGGAVDRDLDDQALMEYLWYGNAFEDRTIYRDVRALQAGWRLVIEDGRNRGLNLWWNIESWLARRTHQKANLTRCHHRGARQAVDEAAVTSATRQRRAGRPVL